MKKGEYHSFRCDTCKNKPVFRSPNGAEELAKHLKTIHSVPDLKGTQSLAIHLDEPEYYRSVYNWDIHGIKIDETLRLKRDKLDASVWKGK
jgi:hypothetical protein